jgi:hypothetical protein
VAAFINSQLRPHLPTPVTDPIAAKNRWTTPLGLTPMPSPKGSTSLGPTPLSWPRIRSLLSPSNFLPHVSFCMFARGQHSTGPGCRMGATGRAGPGAPHDRAHPNCALPPPLWLTPGSPYAGAWARSTHCQRTMGDGGSGTAPGLQRYQPPGPGLERPPGLPAWPVGPERRLYSHYPGRAPAAFRASGAVSSSTAFCPASVRKAWTALLGTIPWRVCRV